VITKSIVLPIVIPEPLVSEVPLFCLYDRHLHNYVTLSMHDHCMHESCLPLPHQISCCWQRCRGRFTASRENDAPVCRLCSFGDVCSICNLLRHQNSCQLFGKQNPVDTSCHFNVLELCLNMRPVTRRRSSQLIRASRSRKYACFS
jgi:hypothetical protein